MTWWRDAWGHPGVRALGLSWLLSHLGTLALAVVGAVFAFTEGGAAEVAYFGVASTLPGIVLTPTLLGLAARYRPDRVLMWTTLARAALTATATVLAATGSLPTVTVTLLALAVALGATFRPTQSVLLPWLARSPRELTAASVAATASENAAGLLGPAGAGALLLWADPALAAGAGSVVLLGAAAGLSRVTVPERRALVTQPAAHPWRAYRAGVRGLVGLAPAGGVAVLVFLQGVLRGSLAVLVVVLALDTLALSDGSVGWFHAVVGCGGLLGAAISAWVLRLNRLGRCFAAGVALWGAGVAVLAVPGITVVLIALLLVGVGNAVEDGGLFTLAPRRLGPALAPAGMGALEVVLIGGVALGSAMAPLTTDLLGVRGALAVLGASVAATALGYAAAFVRFDQAEPATSPHLDLLRGIPFLAPLPLVTVESLAHGSRPTRYPRGAAVVREGEPGRTFEVIVSGSASVDVHGVARRVLGPGDAFGEIALLRDVPRTATVTADSELRTLVLDRGPFLAAVRSLTASRTEAEQFADGLLVDDPSGPAAGPSGAQ